MIRKHSSCELGADVLSNTFSLYTFLNSLMAIGAGLFAQRLVAVIPSGSWNDIFQYGGELAPFGAAIVICILCYVNIMCLWDEFPDQAPKQHTCAPLDLGQTLSDKRLLLLGSVITLFESAMYLFIASWVPTLMEATPSTESLDLGTIFSVFMAASMLGSQCVNLAEGVGLHPLTMSMATAAVCHATAAILTHDILVVFWSFVGFELAVGMYFPAMGKLKASLVEDEHRSVIYSILRTPLNLLVPLLLMLNLGNRARLVATTTMLVIGTLLTFSLLKANAKRIKIV